MFGGNNMEYKKFTSVLNKYIQRKHFKEYITEQIKIFPNINYFPIEHITVYIKFPNNNSCAMLGFATEYLTEKNIKAILESIDKYIIEGLKKREVKMKVKFINVGRNNVCWEETAPANNYDELEYEWLYFQVKKRAFIMSANIDFYLKEGETKGIITAGFHQIGEFELIFE